MMLKRVVKAYASELRETVRTALEPVNALRHESRQTARIAQEENSTQGTMSTYCPLLSMPAGDVVQMSTFFAVVMPAPASVALIWFADSYQ